MTQTTYNGNKKRPLLLFIPLTILATIIGNVYIYSGSNINWNIELSIQDKIWKKSDGLKAINHTINNLQPDLNEWQILNWTEFILPNLLPFNKLQHIAPQRQTCIYNKSKHDLMKKYFNYFNGYNITSILPTYCLQQWFIPNVLTYFHMTPDIFDRSRTIVGDVTNLRYVFQNKLLQENKCIKILVFGGSVCKTHGGTSWTHWFIFWLNIYFKKEHCSHKLVNKCWGGHGIKSHFISISHTFTRDSLLMQHSGYDMILIDTIPNDQRATIYSSEQEQYVEFWCRILLSFKDNPAVIIVASAVDENELKTKHGIGEYMWLKYLNYYQIPTVSMVDVELQLLLRRQSFLSLDVSQLNITDIYYKYYTSKKYDHDTLYMDHIHPNIGGYQVITLLLAHFMVVEKEKYVRLPYYFKQDKNLDLFRLFPNNILPKPFILDIGYKESSEYKCKLYPTLYLSFSNPLFVDYLKRNEIGLRYNTNKKHYESTDKLDYYYNSTNTMFRNAVSTENEMYQHQILNPINNNGFKFMVEISGKWKNVIKPGLIGYNVNDSITFEISVDYKQITIGYLKSYQHNGIALIWIDDYPTMEHMHTAAQYTESMMIVDSLDVNDKTSQIAFATIHNTVYQQKHTERIYLHICIIQGNDARTERKFKILSVLAC